MVSTEPLGWDCVDRVRVDDLSLAVHRRGQGVPTVVLHGGGPGCTSEGDFAEVAELIAPGRELVFVDLPQFGESDAPRIDGPVLDFHARSLAGVLDGIGRCGVDVIAQSLGGSVALRLAAVRPDLVRRVIATGSQPVPFADPSDARIGLGRRVRVAYYGGVGPTPEKMRELIGTLEWHATDALPDQLVERRHAASVSPGSLSFGLDHDGRGLPQDLSAALGAVRARVLLVWGAHDPFSDPGYAEQVARLIPRAQVRVIERAAHHPQSEWPVDYARAVDEFLLDDSSPADLETNR